MRSALQVAISASFGTAFLAFACAVWAAPPPAGAPLRIPGLATTPPRVAADPSPLRAEAEKKFDEGAHAFDRGDFLRAAQAFEDAYRLVPHVDALWNAARAWHRADELARAATLYARLLREAPSDSADRIAAAAELRRLAPRLGRVEVHGDDLRDLAVDDRPVDDHVVYVNPGGHTVRAAVRGALSSQTVEVPAGEVVSVVFEPKLELSTSARTAEPPAAARSAELPRAGGASNASQPGVSAEGSLSAPRSASRSGASPWFFVAGGALTMGFVAATVLSGISTLSAHKAFEAHPTPANLAAGESMQERTNLLLGISMGLGLTTTGVALWLVDWSPQNTSASKDKARGTPVRLEVGPRGVWATGRF